MEITKNRIVHLGEIEWFGGYNRQKDRQNTFGFLVGHFFFHASVLDSPNREKYIQEKLEYQRVFFSLKDEENTDAGAAWVKLISEITEEELKSLYQENDSVKRILNNPADYFSLLDYPVMRALFGDVLQNIGLNRMIEAIRDSAAISSRTLDFLLNSIDLKELSADEAIELFLSLPEGRAEKKQILQETFPAWVDDARVIDKLRGSYFPECISPWLDDNDCDSLARLFHSISNGDTKRVMASFLPKEYFISDPDYLSQLTEDKIVELICDWFEDCVGNAEKLRMLLSVVEPSSHPKAAISLGEKLFQSNVPLDVWKMLTNSEKVWFVLYLSLHLESVESWKKPFGSIYLFEHKTSEDKNFSVLAAIEFLTIALVDESKKQSMFEKAHENLEKAIEKDFDELQRPSKELKQLLCRCKIDQRLVCDARKWQNRNTVWCNTNRESCHRFDDEETDEVNYLNTNYVYNCQFGYDSVLCYLSMADLLGKVGYTPSLVSVYSPVLNYRWDFEEYPYRISGRVAQLNRLFAHMHCRCGRIMRSNFAYSVKIDSRLSITHAMCPEAQMDAVHHDPDVYLNECWNCDEVIDSRESQFIQTRDGQYYPAPQADISGYYVCMKCGAGTLGIVPAVCPSCGCTDQDSLEFIVINREPLKQKFVKCNNCGYSSRDWASQFERQNREVDELIPGQPVEIEEDIF